MGGSGVDQPGTRPPNQPSMRLPCWHAIKKHHQRESTCLFSVARRNATVGAWALVEPIDGCDESAARRHAKTGRDIPRSQNTTGEDKQDLTIVRDHLTTDFRGRWHL